MFRGAWNCLDDVRADSVDSALRRHGITSIRLDRSMLPESREAWVHVIVSALTTEPATRSKTYERPRARSS
ncbi:DUF6210 family protein [Steroidobacter flavus]|uniref:DUF6210 family protein n=1 Tax=Steroidobacter flavus TaxID=1842136 RepID=A0ABV8SXP1_9GAMM